MPRASPEETIVSIPYWNQQYNQFYTGFTAVKERRRTWWGSVTPGFPDVKPLPFRNHYMDFQRKLLDPKFEVRQDRWFAGKPYDIPYWLIGPSQYYGVGFPDPMGHVTSAFLYGDVKAKAKVIADIQRLKANVAQNIAEYRQVDRMFTTNVRRITSAYRAIRRGDIEGLSRSIPLRRRHKQSLLNRGPLDIRRNAPSVWLEAQYGWLPLVGDTYTVLTKFYSRVESGVRIRAEGRDRYMENSRVPLGATVGAAAFDDYTRRIRRCKWIIEYEVDDTRLANLDDWGITNPALLAWELVPYSFVVDWFYPVGDWLSQVGYSLGLYFVRGMRSSVAEATTVRRYKKATADAYPYYWKVRGTDTVQSAVFHRELVSNFPSPGWPKPDPGGLRGKRIFNALSLLALAFDRKPRK